MVPSAKNGHEADSGIPEKSIKIHMFNVSWMVATPFFLFVFGGIWLDRQNDSSPLYFFLGLFIALVAISATIYKYVSRYFPDSFGETK